MTHKRSGLAGLTMVSIALVAIGCSEDKPRPTPQEPAPDLNESTQRGWDLYRARRFPEAESLFRLLVDAFPDAPGPYVGLGWCDLESDSLGSAIDLFENALRLEGQADAYAGLTIAASASGMDSLAVETAGRITDPAYVFHGNPTFGYLQVVYMKALGEFHLLRWEDCYSSLHILDPDLVIDLEAWDFREQLFAALETLQNSP